MRPGRGDRQQDSSRRPSATTPRRVATSARRARLSSRAILFRRGRGGNGAGTGCPLGAGTERDPAPVPMTARPRRPEAGAMPDLHSPPPRRPAIAGAAATRRCGSSSAVVQPAATVSDDRWNYPSVGPALAPVSLYAALHVSSARAARVRRSRLPARAGGARLGPAWRSPGPGACGVRRARLDPGHYGQTADDAWLVGLIYGRGTVLMAGGCCTAGACHAAARVLAAGPLHAAGHRRRQLRAVGSPRPALSAGVALMPSRCARACNQPARHCDGAMTSPIELAPRQLGCGAPPGAPGAGAAIVIGPCSSRST